MAQLLLHSGFDYKADHKAIFDTHSQTWLLYVSTRLIAMVMPILAPYCLATDASVTGNAREIGSVLLQVILYFEFKNNNALCRQYIGVPRIFLLGWIYTTRVCLTAKFITH